MRTSPLRDDASPAVLNALAILESFDAEHASQSLSELSRRLHIAKATALRNLAALQHYGYVRKDADKGTYSLGVQVLSLARRFAEQNHLLSIGALHIGELAKATSETAHLSVLAGRDIVYADVSEGSQHVRAVVRRGDRLPAHVVASGKAILAHAETRILTEFLAGGLPALTQSTITRAEDFIGALDDVRRLGYGTSLGEWMVEVSAVAAPVFGTYDKIVGAIGIAGPRLRLGPKVIAHLASAVVAQAQRLSRELGSTGAPYAILRAGSPRAQPSPAKARRLK